jgi:A/G-specific adenine glycosylase
VSEVILQQTTVAAGAPRWRRFLSRFPTVESLAAASESEVLAEWSGLGYYARARNLHRAARRVVALAGGIPRTTEGLRALPGVGPYTAAAVASIAFGVPAAVVDGNVARVLARFLAIPGDARSSRFRHVVERAADALLDRRSPGEHNQALMELGALVCLPRAPRCEECPLARACRARAEGTPECFPSRRARRPARSVRLAAGVARRRGRVVLVEDVHLVRGHVVVPLVEVAEGGDARSTLASAWARLAGRDVARLAPLGVVRHSVLDRRYVVEVFDVVEGATSRGGSRPHVLTAGEIEATPRGGLLGKVLSLSAPSEEPRGRASRGPAPPKRRGG